MANDATRDASGRYLDLQGAEQKIGDPGAMRELLFKLEKLLATDVPTIEQGVASGDLAVASAALHSLKGCLPIFCLPPICDCVAAAEQAAKSGNESHAIETFAALHPALLQLRLEIGHYLLKR